MSLLLVLWLPAILNGITGTVMQTGVGDELTMILLRMGILAFILLLLGSISWFVISPAIDHLLIARVVDGRQRRAAHRLTKSVLAALVISIAFFITGVPALILPTLVLVAVIRIGYLFREPLTDLILLDERYRNNR